MKKISRMATVVLMVGALGACAFHGGHTHKQVSTTTLGQELSDLKIALDNGAITESEYRTVKQELINACGSKASLCKHSG